MAQPTLEDRFSAHTRYFRAGATLSRASREERLRSLLAVYDRMAPRILEACHADLRRNETEARASEVSLVRGEAELALRKLRAWMRPRRTLPPLVNWPALGAIEPRPLGVNLIISPWNYPFLLTFSPLVACLAAGNVAMIKPSELSAASAEVIAEIVREALPPECASVVLGGPEEAQALLRLPFDHIFFTGSPRVGRIVARAASEHLTRVTLELGGKSPVVVMPTADLDLAARRIAMGKFFNTGQSCVAPDYLLVHHSVRDGLVERLRAEIGRFFGPDPRRSPDYGRIINEAHTQRIADLIDPARVIHGGTFELADRYIAPTLLGDVSLDDRVMQEEIFGPLLPILPFDTREEAMDIIAHNPRPLALYLFTAESADEREFTSRVPFGGGCINSTLLHFADTSLPFGGIGGSGYGVSHGEHGFRTFSHAQGMLKAGSFLDLPLRYPPYTPRKKAWIRRILG